MRKMSVVIIPVFSLFLGCAATHFPELSSWPAMAQRKGIELENVNKTVSPSSKLIEARNKYIEKKQSELSQIIGVIDKKLEELRGKADRRSVFSLCAGGAGIVSGVAATTLAIASPANAVWVAGFSALGTGVISFQMRASLEGYSRDAVVRVYTETIAKIQDATSQIGADFEFLRQNVNSTGDTFDKRAGELDAKLVRLNITAVLTPLVVGTDQDFEKLKKGNEEILKKLDETQKQIDKINK